MAKFRPWVQDFYQILELYYFIRSYEFDWNHTIEKKNHYEWKQTSVSML